MTKVLVTGSTGFLGKHLLLKLVGQNFSVTALCRNIPDSANQIMGVTYLTGDVEDPFSLKDCLQSTDVVIHGAALVSVQPADHVRMYQVNVTGTKNLVDASIAQGVRKFILISSVAALGESGSNQTIDETVIFNGYKSGYGYTKYLSELEVFRGGEEGLQVSIVNPSVILGPHQGVENRSTGKIFQFIRSRIPFAPDGLINLVDARDVAEVVSRLTTDLGNGQRYILNGGTLSWLDFFSKISNELGLSTNYRILPTSLAYTFIGVQQFISRLINRPATITLTAIKMAISRKTYDNRKVSNELNFNFHNLEDTLKWSCSEG